jgi:hypothetical protein
MAEGTGSMARAQRRWLGFFTGVAMALLFITGFLAWGGMQRAMLAWSALTLPTELRHAVFVTSYEQESIMRQATLLGFTEKKVPGRITAVAHGGPTEAFIALVGHEAVLHLDTGSIALTEAPQTHLSVSPLGHSAVFTLHPASSTATTTFNSVTYIAPGHAPETHTPLATGFAAFYLDPLHILRFAENGVYISDLEKATSTLLRKEFTPRTPSFLGVSPDGSLVAWSTLTPRTTIIYRVGTDALTPVATIARQFGPQSRLGNDAIYEVRQEKGTSNVWRISFDGSQRMIASFPFPITSFAL